MVHWILICGILPYPLLSHKFMKYWLDWIYWTVLCALRGWHTKIWWTVCMKDLLSSRQCCLQIEPAGIWIGGMLLAFGVAVIAGIPHF